MRFEWDEGKNRRNLAKHKISFETAKLVFEDPGLLVQKDREVAGEERWQALGLIGGVVIVLVCTRAANRKAKRWSALSQPERPLAGKGKLMTKLTKTQAKEIRALRRMKDEEVDFTDIPLTADWSKEVVGKFYRPIKKSLTIRLDADVLAWLRGQGKGYQTRINALLRNTMESSVQRAPRNGARHQVLDRSGRRRERQA